MKPIASRFLKLGKPIPRNVLHSGELVFELDVSVLFSSQITQNLFVPYKSIEADSLTFEQGDTVLLLTPDGQTYYIAGKVRDGHV